MRIGEEVSSVRVALATVGLLVLAGVLATGVSEWLRDMLPSECQCVCEEVE